jgi:hypothetical protein
LRGEPTDRATQNGEEARSSRSVTITLGSAAATWPLAAWYSAAAQFGRKVWRIGYLSGMYGLSELTRSFVQGLRELGYVEGQNLIVEYRFAMGKNERLAELAASPWQNGHVERLIGSIRRACTDHLIVFSAAHLRRILTKYAIYYNKVRTHVSLGKDAPSTRAIERFREIIAQPILGGLHHRYSTNLSFRKRHSIAIAGWPDNSAASPREYDLWHAPFC